ncbi:MAG TPA: hypothetical protein VLH39_02310 [Magnetospirillaceae bacterium]|nr:hypothetical protein [Magnetospirillaceae bacterium]
MTMHRKLIALAVLAAMGALVFAQHSLFDNPNYRRSLELRRMAESAFNQGDFSRAEELSKESERLSILARLEAEDQLQQWTANAWRNRAAERIAFGEKNDAAGQLGAVWTEARDSYAVAVREFEARRWAESIQAGRRVIDLMKDFSPARLPAFYVVRLIPERRDSLWRIAEYPFVYGDPWKWRVLYEANRENMPEPGNPDLIHPGMVLRIPSIEGETRVGTWAGR